MGKSTISMAIFNSYVSLPEGNVLMNVARWLVCRFEDLPIRKKLTADENRGFKHLGVNDYSSSGVITRSILHGYFNPLVFWY